MKPNKAMTADNPARAFAENNYQDLQIGNEDMSSVIRGLIRGYAAGAASRDLEIARLTEALRGIKGVLADLDLMFTYTIRPDHVSEEIWQKHLAEIDAGCGYLDGLIQYDQHDKQLFISGGYERVRVQGWVGGVNGADVYDGSLQDEFNRRTDAAGKFLEAAMQTFPNVRKAIFKINDMAQSALATSTAAEVEKGGKDG